MIELLKTAELRMGYEHKDGDGLEWLSKSSLTTSNSAEIKIFHPVHTGEAVDYDPRVLTLQDLYLEGK